MLATLGSLKSAPAKVSGVTSADAGTVGNTTLPMLKVTLSPSTYENSPLMPVKPLWVAVS